MTSGSHGLKRNRYLNHRIEKDRRRDKMTYVLGAVCNDGVVIVADKKVTGGTGEKYTKKIQPLSVFPTIYFTAAGLQPLFEEFLGEISRRSLRTYNYLEEQNKNLSSLLQYKYDVYNFKQDCVNLLKDMHSTYSNTGVPDDETALQVLFVLRENFNGVVKPRLYYADWGDRFPIPIEGKVVIGQGHLAELFLKSYNEKMSMRDVARLASFVIKYIEKEQLSDGVGIGIEEPQILFYPNDAAMPRELDDNEVIELLTGIDKRVEEIVMEVGSRSRFLMD